MRKNILDLIVKSHCELMEDFYMNYDTKNFESSYKMREAHHMLKSCTHNFKTSNLINTVILIKNSKLEGDTTSESESHQETEQLMGPRNVLSSTKWKMKRR
jgi:hypothetical protein